MLLEKEKQNFFHIFNSSLLYFIINIFNKKYNTNYDYNNFSIKLIYTIGEVLVFEIYSNTINKNITIKIQAIKSKYTLVEDFEILTNDTNIILYSFKMYLNTDKIREILIDFVELNKITPPVFIHKCFLLQSHASFMLQNKKVFLLQG